MDSPKPFKHQSSSPSYNIFSSFLTKKLIPLAFSVLLPLAIVHFYLYPLIPSFLSSFSSFSDKFQLDSSSSSSVNSSSSDLAISRAKISCDYGKGRWVHDKIGPLYNGTSCGTIKDNQNCMIHGRPDKGYLYWKWKPNHCKIPRFKAHKFLELTRNKHLAFVGDSIARNQVESLLCLLSTASVPKLVYTSKDKDKDEKFRKWHFVSHNVSISIYWSPFLVKGIEKKSDISPENYNTLFLESVDERWATDLAYIDMIVLSVGHWFLHRAIYYYQDSVLGCHYCSELNNKNYSEIGFYDVYGKAFKTALNVIIERKKKNKKTDQIDVIVTTFTPAHFEGDWDKFGACPKIKPYNSSEKKLDGMNAEMRQMEMEQIKIAKEKVQELGKQNIRIHYLDVTRLSLLRPDGHPGPYLYPFPFANGIPDRVQNDCVHWCLPGPIDTWNEILLDIMEKWEEQNNSTAR